MIHPTRTVVASPPSESVVSDAELAPFRNLRRLEGRYAPKHYVVTTDTHAYVRLIHGRRLDPRRTFLYDSLTEALVNAGQCRERGVVVRVLVLGGRS